MRRRGNVVDMVVSVRYTREHANLRHCTIQYSLGTSTVRQLSGKPVRIMRRSFAWLLSACSRQVEVRQRQVPMVEVRRPQRCAESREPPPTTGVPVQIYRALVEGIARLSTGRQAMNDRKRRNKGTHTRTEQFEKSKLGVRNFPTRISPHNFVL
jgi:hypothetical protein